MVIIPSAIGLSVPCQHQLGQLAGHASIRAYKIPLESIFLAFRENEVYAYYHLDGNIGLFFTP